MYRYLVWHFPLIRPISSTSARNFSGAHKAAVAVTQFTGNNFAIIWGKGDSKVYVEEIGEITKIQ